MLIADIDFGDDRLSKFAGVENADDVIASVSDLALLDNDCPATPWEASFAEESYRVYRTHSGCRVVCTSRRFPRTQDNYPADRLMRFLRADRHYMELCQAQKCYRARLTPKPWRCDGEPNHVCELIHEHRPGVIHPELAEQLAVHDEMTLANGSDSMLA
jgi:hypothetical protein